MGFRFTVNSSRNKKLPGKPDIILPRHNTIIFVHGCFWHQHPGCKEASMPTSSHKGIDWPSKLGKNVARDRRNQRQLRKMGWHVVVIWTCDILKHPARVVRRLERLLSGEEPRPITYTIPRKKDLLKAAERRADYTVLAKTARADRKT
jgi:DNA mismatch endonuclease (patch repair protein)